MNATHNMIQSWSLIQTTRQKSDNFSSKSINDIHYNRICNKYNNAMNSSKHIFKRCRINCTCRASYEVDGTNVPNYMIPSSSEWILPITMKSKRSILVRNN